MSDQVPNFSNESIARILMELYGLEGEISSLVSFEDQNALIKTSGEDLCVYDCQSEMVR